MTFRPQQLAMAIAAATLYSSSAEAALFGGTACVTPSPTTVSVCTRARIEFLAGGAGHVWIGTDVYRMRWSRRGNVVTIDVTGTSSRLRYRSGCLTGVLTVNGANYDIDVCGP